jgi:hypothetical protein
MAQKFTSAVISFAFRISAPKLTRNALVARNPLNTVVTPFSHSLIQKQQFHSSSFLNAAAKRNAAKANLAGEYDKKIAELNKKRMAATEYDEESWSEIFSTYEEMRENQVVPQISTMATLIAMSAEIGNVEVIK